MKKLIILFAAILLLSGMKPLFSAAGDATALFLTIPPDAKSSSLGEAGVAADRVRDHEQAHEQGRPLEAGTCGL